MKIFVFLIFTILIWNNMFVTAYAESLPGCRNIDENPGIKVILDKIEYISETGIPEVLTDNYTYKCRILNKLRAKLDQFFPGTQPFICEARFPSPDGSDFNTNLVKTLNSRDVLIELWGAIEAKNNDGGITIGGYICIIIIPVRYEEGNVSRLDFHLLSFPFSDRGPIEKACIDMLFGTEFDVYVGIAKGINELNDNNYPNATEYFERAHLNWETAMSNNKLADTDTDHNRILAYIEELQERTNEEAATADPEYKENLDSIRSAQKDKEN